MTDKEPLVTGRDWWLGVADMVTAGLEHGAHKVERVHLSVADETFRVLHRIPVTQPVSDPVRIVHHGISRFCYRCVSGVARAGNGILTYL